MYINTDDIKLIIYMHEVAEDAGYRSSGWNFIEALQWIVIWRIGLLIHTMIGNKLDKERI